MGEILRFVPIPIGGEVLTPDGGRLIALYEDPGVAKRDQVTVSSTGAHERDHALVAKKLGLTVLEMSIVPQGESNGHVITDVANPIVAAASFGNGHSGYWHDEGIVLALRHDPESAGSVARSIAESAPDERDELGRMIEVEKTADDRMVTEAMRDGKEGRRVIVLFEDRAGRKKKEIKTRIKGQIAMIPDIEYELPQAA